MTSRTKEQIIALARKVAAPGTVDPVRNGFVVLTPKELERFTSLTRADLIDECKKLILDDAYAITFQTFGQYRTALAKELEKMK